jgi:hypothetical protein
MHISAVIDNGCSLDVLTTNIPIAGPVGFKLIDRIIKGENTTVTFMSILLR